MLSYHSDITGTQESAFLDLIDQMKSMGDLSGFNRQSGRDSSVKLDTHDRDDRWGFRFCDIT